MTVLFYSVLATTNFFSKGIVVTDGSRICMVTIHAVSNGSDLHRCTYIGSSLVGAIAAQRGRIIYHETTTKHLQCLQLNGAKYTYIFARDVGSVSGENRIHFDIFCVLSLQS